MKINADDARLTAFVLDELEESERLEIEQAARESAEVRDRIDEIRASADLLTEAFAAEAAVGLSREQRQAIEEAAPKAPSASRRISRWLYPALAAAALVLMWFAFPVRYLFEGGESKGVELAELTRLPLERTFPASDPMSAAAVAGPDLDRLSDSARLSRGTPSDDSQSRMTEEERAELSQLPVDKAHTQAEMVGIKTVLGPAARTLPTPSEQRSQSEASSRPVLPSAAIYGRVTDQSGVVLPGVALEVLSPKGELQSGSTDALGEYRISNLPAGKLRLRAGLPGFQSHAEEVDVEEGSQVPLNFALELGTFSETRTIIAELQRSQRKELPLNGRVSVQPSSQSGPLGKLVDGVMAMAPPPPIEADADRGVGTPRPDFNTEAYDRLHDNPFLEVSQNPLSTFSIDVDTASYSNIRRFLRDGSLPPKDAVRIEEMINYFSYDYPQPKGKEPFSVNLEVTAAPWDRTHRLVRIGLRGRQIASEQRPDSNLVFLLDVSGSMQPYNKLPLLKKAMRMLVEKLGEQDRVAIVVYAGASGLVLPSTPGIQKERILAALDQLEAGGSTNGAAGIELAYQTARAHFIKGGINRVILATDGDFNVGVTNSGDLTRLIEKEAADGVFLSVLGFGMGNLKDSTLEKLADQGNGNYAYIDGQQEARKVLLEEMDSTLITIAKDVKIQVEFNPQHVQAYRLIGYENRLLRKEDFNDDTKDAGEIGAGHTVTALYEIVPPGGQVPTGDVDSLKYQQTPATRSSKASPELMTVKLRFKEPEAQSSQKLEVPLIDSGHSVADASPDLKFAAAVAAFGMLLRDSPYKGAASMELCRSLAEEGKGKDLSGYRTEFLQLLRRATQLGLE